MLMIYKVEELKDEMIKVGALFNTEKSIVRLSSGEGIQECAMLVKGDVARVHTPLFDSIVEISLEGAEQIMREWPNRERIESICCDANEDIGRFEIVKVIRKGRNPK